jgi:hypothetical protein
MRLFLLLNVVLSLSYAEKIEGKIAGSVSKKAITYHQLSQMISFKLMQSNIENSKENRELFKKQALSELQRLWTMRWLCDQVKFSLNPKEIDDVMLDVAKQNGKTLTEFESDLKQKGVSLLFVRFFIETNRQFAAYIRARFEKNVKITPEKFDNLKKKIEKSLKETAFELEEALIEGDQAMPVAQQLVKSYKNQQFKGLNQFKSLGWICESDLGDLKNRISSMKIGEATIIPLTPTKCRVIIFKNKKNPDQNDPLDCILTLGQIIIPKDHPNFEDLKIRFLDKLTSDHQWNQLERDAQEYDIQTTISRDVHVKYLDPQMIEKLKPFFIKKHPKFILIDDPQAYLFVFLLSKDTPPPIKIPSDQEIKSILEQEEFKKCADKALHESKFLVHIDERL